MATISLKSTQQIKQRLLQINVFFLLLLSTNTTFSQPTTNIYVLSPIVGDTIESAEKAKYHLFPFLKTTEYQYGILYQLSDTTYLLKSLVKDSCMERVLSKEEMLWNQNMIVGGFETKNSLKLDSDLVSIHNPVDSTKIYKIELKEGDIFLGHILQKDSNSLVIKSVSIPKQEIHFSEIKSLHEISKLERKNAFYFELGGSNLIYALNYERSIFHSKSLKQNLGIGTSFLYYPGWVRYFFVSSKYSLIFGQRNSKLETGLGFTLGAGSETTVLAPNVRLLYRLEKDNGFLFRAGIMGGLFFRKYDNGYIGKPLVLPEISFGYSF